MTASSGIASATTTAGGTGHPFTDTDGDDLDDNWETGQYGSISAYSASDDPDGDGLSVMWKMAFGGSSTVTGMPDDVVKISINGEEHGVLFSYRRPRNYNQLRLTYQMQASGTLGIATWADDPSSVSSIVADRDGVTEWVTHTHALLGATPRQFYRCHVTSIGSP
jgi:hypothetical protein